MMFAHFRVNGATIKFLGEREFVSTGSEYILRNYPEESLVTIHVLGAVGKPGLYHVPDKTDVVTLMSLTGGSSTFADLENVVLRKRNPDKVKRLNLNKMIGTQGLYPEPLHNGDIIFVNSKDPVVDKNTVLVLSVVSVILTIITTSIAIRDTN